MTVDPNDILALLEDGPKRLAQLADWLKAPTALVRSVLLDLVDEHRAKQIPAEHTWAIVPASERATPAPAPTRKRTTQPKTEMIPAAAPPSWWCCPPDEFSARHSKELPRIAGSPMAREVRSVILGGKLP